MRDAPSIVSEDSALEVERWASGWLGAAWSTAVLGEREPEKILHLEVVGRASTRPSPHGLAAVAALRRLLDELEALQVSNARTQGWTWQAIAAALGVRRQSVHKKHAGRV